jgi:hypothetical protein
LNGCEGSVEFHVLLLAGASRFQDRRDKVGEFVGDRIKAFGISRKYFWNAVNDLQNSRLKGLTKVVESG